VIFKNIGNNCFFVHILHHDFHHIMIGASIFYVMFLGKGNYSSSYYVYQFSPFSPWVFKFVNPTFVFHKQMGGEGSLLQAMCLAFHVIYLCFRLSKVRLVMKKFVFGSFLGFVVVTHSSHFLLVVWMETNKFQSCIILSLIVESLLHRCFSSYQIERYFGTTITTLIHQPL